MARAVTPQEPRPHSSIKPKQGTSEVVPPAPTKRSAETLRQLTECRWRARPSKSAGLRRQSGGKTDHSTRLLRSRSEEHTSELQSLMSISYAVFCLKKKKQKKT